MIDATQSEAAGHQQCIRRGHLLISNKVLSFTLSLYAFKITVRKAMKERPNDDEPVIIKE